MAIRIAFRWKPDAYRSTNEATVADLRPRGESPAPETPGQPPAEPTGVPAGTIVMIQQAVAYDTDRLSAASYRPGDPATERNIVVLHERVRQYDLTAAHNASQAQIDTFLATELAGYRDWVAPAIPALARVAYAARQSTPIVLE